MRLEQYSASESPGTFSTDFGALPHSLREDPYRTGMLPAPVCERFLAAPYPAPKDFWICYKDDQPVGGISANVSAAHPDTGFFGLFELDLESDYADVADALLSAATEWLATQGISRIVGPIAFNTWFPYRFRIDSDDRSFEWEPTNPPEYIQAVEASSFERGESYNSTAFGNLKKVAAKLEPAYRKSVADGFSFRAFGEDSIDIHVPTLYRLSHDAFTDNYLFEPISEPLFAESYVSIADKGGRILSWLVLDPEGEPIGFFYTFIDHCIVNGAKEIAMVLKSIGITPAARGKGLSNAMMYLAIRAAVELEVDYAISAMVHTGIQSESYARKGEYLWRHEYALWQKQLT